MIEKKTCYVFKKDDLFGLAKIHSSDPSSIKGDLLIDEIPCFKCTNCSSEIIPGDVQWIIVSKVIDMINGKSDFSKLKAKMIRTIDYQKAGV